MKSCSCAIVVASVAYGPTCSTSAAGPSSKEISFNPAAAGSDFLAAASAARCVSRASVTASGWRIIRVQCQCDRSPVRKVLRSSAHHSPSRAETVKFGPPTFLTSNLAAWDTVYSALTAAE
jgi:hypothetical protein